MNSKEFFCEALDTYVQFPSRQSAIELHQACGAVWNDSETMSINARPDVEAVVRNSIEFEQWETGGRTYSGAARRIRPVIKQEHDLA
ncbi:hypothetical protein PhaeoP30_01836 [Phaeobacter inhibens]|uniref:hypothetical protein n=1 Tax=Phaeobacter inhibens TaxID=221822 RepID=UPI000C9B05FE|nr:hypothetical protein [Phaeobacter inhibens]AUQ58751.1 hypothetical protein PhaeoP30_01836 [Phaeobacter inhibens]AUQ62841.1 hypothetical protein PhaeoP51_01856 [Phaeobacter inhibens]AUQ82745.1 hypothetical protein PhaeoP57_01815 [Phaeobacter inhibens]AUQ90506.1 hypothetical protein PhaeoP24_01889 [Phaeobacter inhibens]MDO6754728.1 hypothetical protein [Phaeobacter inhibens]